MHTKIIYVRIYKIKIKIQQIRTEWNRISLLMPHWESLHSNNIVKKYNYVNKENIKLKKKRFLVFNVYYMSGTFPHTSNPPHGFHFTFSLISSALLQRGSASLYLPLLPYSTARLLRVAATAGWSFPSVFSLMARASLSR